MCIYTKIHIEFPPFVDNLWTGQKSVEIQAQHRPSRLRKPRTESVGTDRWGRVPSTESVGTDRWRRERYSVRNIFWSLCRRSLRALKYDSTSVSPSKELYKSVHWTHTHYREHWVSAFFEIEFSFSLSLSLSLSLPRMLREPKHSIKPAFLFLYSVPILASTRYFLQYVIMELV